MAYFQGVLGILAGLAFLGLGYTDWFKSIFEHFNIAIGDLLVSKVLGYFFLIGGIIWIFYGAFKKGKS